MPDPFKMEASLAAKVGSVLVHVDEFTSVDGHPFDMEAIKALLAQPDVVAWISSLQKLALVPVKRAKASQTSHPDTK
jgi:hypothetical protein